jgi:DNA processing protein
MLESADPRAEDVERVTERAVALGCVIRTPADDEWLARLWSEMTDPPAALYVQGKLHGPEQRAVAIVGTRHPSANGLELARGIARDLSAEGVTIVSGMALGIDGAAHRGALDVEGHTVAVLGCGIDRPHPPSHIPLSRRIAETGALVSEFPFGTHPRPLHFPRRNRIIAALANVVVIVEGSHRSGARSTVDHALALGREVVAVPRDPVHEGSALPNLLLRTGAAPVRSALDVLDHLEGCRGPAQEGSLLDSADSALLDLFGSEAPRSVEGLARAARRPPEEVLLSLGRLELTGRVRRLPGARFARPGSDG